MPDLPENKKSKQSGWIKAIEVVVLTAVALFGYSLWEYRSIKVTMLDLPKHSGLADIKIVYASDFQYDSSWREGAMQQGMYQKAVDLINSQNPDVILLGGDYVNYPVHSEEAARQLARLSAPYGIYGVFGNHDYRARETFRTALDGKITFLENETHMIPYRDSTLAICGVEDDTKGDPRISEISDSADYSILLTHQPDFFEICTDEELANFDLTLTGHTHAGQITFFGLAGIPPVIAAATDYGEKYRYGNQSYDGNNIYITSGLGGNVFGLPLRFGARPEIVVLQSVQS